MCIYLIKSRNYYLPCLPTFEIYYLLYTTFITYMYYNYYFPSMHSSVFNRNTWSTIYYELNSMSTIVVNIQLIFKHIFI